MKIKGIYIPVDTLSLSILFCSPNAAKQHFIRAKTKLILELTIIDIQIDFNCRKNKISVYLYIVPIIFVASEAQRIFVIKIILELTLIVFLN